MSAASTRWSQLTWREVPEALSLANHAAILPIGATEQHGPHMGCGMDYILAEHLCRAVSEKTRVPMLPTMPYGCSVGHSRRWPGTLAVQPITLIELIKQIGDWAYYSGVRRLFIVNTHVTNAAPLRCALEMLRSNHDDLMVAIFNTGTLSQRVRDFHFADGDDWHANDAETSLMLALQPDMVRDELLHDVDDPDRTDGLVFSHPVNRTSANGVTGKPSMATADKGREGFAMLVEDLSELIQRGLSEEPPLSHSYFDSMR
ncbi:MAG: creatininase family protein [Spongiibacteraceae bacterium]